MSTLEYLIFIVPLATTALGIFGFKYGSAAYQARARAANEATYRELAHQAVNAQAETAASLAAMREDLEQVRARLAAVQKILQEVD
jgi:Tfp pilus assembly protein PilO